MTQVLTDLPDDHDLANLEAALKHVTCWDVAVDGGAHRGIWTKCMAARFARVYAFEPVCDNYSRIPDIANVEVIGKALGECHKRVGMRAGAENTGQWHVCAGWDTAVVPLDHYELDGVGLLKLDLEGYEYLALCGAIETIQRCRPVILVEEKDLTSRYGASDEVVRRLLRDMKYRRVEKRVNDQVYVCER